MEYLPKIEWPKHDIIWNLYLYDGRSLQQFSKLDDIYYMKINSAAEVNLTSLDNVRYLEIHDADITEKSNIGDMKKLISVTFQNCTVDGIGECSKLENLAQIVIYDGKCMSLSGLETCNNDICLDIPYVKINQNAINDLQNVNISSMIIDSDFEGNLSQLKNISMIDVFGENISQQLISNISEIDSLEKIKLHGSINNEDIAIMKQSQNLKGLDINGLDISDLTPVASLTNIEELDISNTNVTDAAQQAAREKAFVDKVDELQDAGLSLKEAEEQAEKWLDTQAAVHNPDQVAGGYASNVGGVGDKGVNSSISSQWRYRIDDVDAQIKKWQRVCLKQRKIQHILM